MYMDVYGVYWGYNSLILTFDPNFLDISASPLSREEFHEALD